MNSLRFPALRRDAIFYWNDLLSSLPEPESVVAHLVQTQRDRGLTIGERPFCMVARPRFVTTEEMRQEHRAVSVLSRAVRKVRDAVLEDHKRHADYLGGFNEWIDTIHSMERPTPSWSSAPLPWNKRGPHRPCMGLRLQSGRKLFSSRIGGSRI